MTHHIRTVLWFNVKGHEAADFYCSLIPNSRVETSFSSSNGGPDGNSFFEVVDFNLNGVPYQILDAGPHFLLTEAVSRRAYVSSFGMRVGVGADPLPGPD